MADLEWDQHRFDAVLRDYMEVSKRSVEQIVNTKAYYIARKAIWFTAKASRGAIANDLGSRRPGSRRLTLQPASRPGNEGAPLAALIIQAARARKGLKGLYGAVMAKAVDDLVALRMRSLAFLKSGWLPAVRILAPLADKGGAPAMDPAARQFGRDQGTAKAARPGWEAFAEIINNAASLSQTSRQTGFANFKKYGEEGLRLAFVDETASMEQYIEDHMAPAAAEFNRRAA